VTTEQANASQTTTTNTGGVMIESDKDKCVASVMHSDQRLYHFYYHLLKREWYLLTTQADFHHFGLNHFQSQMAANSTCQNSAIQQDMVGYEQMQPPVSVMKQIHIHQPDIAWLSSCTVSPNTKMSPGEFKTKMQHRQALRDKYQVIRVPSDFQSGDEYHGIIFNYAPWVLDGDQFECENVCLCCHSCDDSNCTEDALQDGIMFHYCYTLDIWYMMIDTWCLDDEPVLREEMLTNQRAAHAKYASSKAAIETPAFMTQEIVLRQQHPTLAPAHPSDVLRCTTQTRRVTNAGAPIEALKWDKAIRPSTCMHGIDACLREYKNPVKSQNHRQMFLHPWPIINTYPGLNYITPIPYVVVAGESEPVTKFMTRESCIELFIKGFSPVAHPDSGLSLEDVDQLPIYHEIITRRFIPDDVEGILGDLWTPLQKRIHQQTVVRLHVMAKALMSGDVPVSHHPVHRFSYAFH
jgi:hypothetical protein